MPTSRSVAAKAPDLCYPSERKFDLRWIIGYKRLATMPFIEAPTTFYMGRRYDPSSHRLVDEVVYYDSRDLTTHAVVVGMTGSGKTGLCIDLLEEAVLDNIPAIVIDPKGDITNLLLTFPNLAPEDFAPCINRDDARRAGLDPPELTPAL